MNIFIVAKRNIKIDKKLIEKNSVGILRNKGQQVSRVFFIQKWIELEIPNNDFEIIDVEKTGDGFEKKICNVCHKLLDTELFARNQNGINNRIIRRPSCKNCRAEIDGVSIKPSIKKEWNKTKPNKEPFECPICHKRTIAGITSKIVLDHDHDTGEVRQWICDSCNTGIGRFKDDEKIILNALKYLRKFQS